MRRKSKTLEKHKRALLGAEVSELVDIFGPWLCVKEHLSDKRQRLFTMERIFWLFLSQILSSDQGCREVVRKFLAWLALEDNHSAAPGTGGYCRARKRLPQKALDALHKKLLAVLSPLEGEAQQWCGRNVKVVDGSALSMPDTEDNQAAYPQPKTQKYGCGFPVMRIVGLFSLSGGLLLDVATGALKIGENALFRHLWDTLKSGDVLLADRGFCSYANYYLLAQRGVDCVMRNHQCRTVGVREVKQLGKGDRLIHWIKSKPMPKGWDRTQWNAVPEILLLREITIHIEEPGFRTEKIVVATTLLDPNQFSKQAIAELYLKRWRVELYFRDIKITMGMDILRCKTPDMVQKELYMHILAYNLVRGLILQAANKNGLSPERISLKGAVASVRQWAPMMMGINDAQRLAWLQEGLLNVIARDLLPLRPNRMEPRAVKRRPKNYQRLTKPRGQFKECMHRK